MQSSCCQTDHSCLSIKKWMSKQIEDLKSIGAHILPHMVPTSIDSSFTDIKSLLEYLDNAGAKLPVYVPISVCRKLGVPVTHGHGSKPYLSGQVPGTDILEIITDEGALYQIKLGKQAADWEGKIRDWCYWLETKGELKYLSSHDMKYCS